MNKEQRLKLYRIIVAAVLFIAGLLMKLSDGFWLPFIFSFVAWMLAGYDVLLEAVEGLWHGEWLDENFLMTLASVAGFCTGNAPEAAAVMIFFQVGELFQDIAVGKSRKSISALASLLPQNVSVFRDGSVTEISPDEVGIGETILVRPGERIPLDGKILSGASSLNTAALTGESLPRDVNPGDTVLSGCVNLTAALTVTVEKTFDNSAVSRILSMVEDASSRKSEQERFIDKFARYYTPAVVIAALAVALLPPLFIGAGSLVVWKEWIHRAMVFLVISCPCALVISIPMAFFGGIGGASSKGILVKGSGYLEALASCTTVAFDKTGTLTEGSFKLLRSYPADGTTEDQLLTAAAYAESRSDHPIARSILDAYGAEPIPRLVGESRAIPGMGVCTEMLHPKGKQILCAGSAAFLRQIGADCPDLDDADGTLVYIASRKGSIARYLGALCIGDSLKEDASDAVAALHEVGVETLLLTGDRSESAESLAASLGIDFFAAELLPEDKVAEIGLRAGGDGKIAFVGDGINDAPVLAAADIGIAMGALGSDAAVEAADIVLADDKPSKVATAITIARKTVKIAKQNIVLSLAVKAAILLLDLLSATPAFSALAPYMTWLAVFADVGVAILTILNAMRAMRVED